MITGKAIVNAYSIGLTRRLYAEHDANFDVKSITDITGVAVERFEYDPYGQRSELDASFSPSYYDAYNWDVGFQGGVNMIQPTEATIDNVTLIQFDNRIYDTELGRWLQQDPAGYIDGGNRYQFVKSNPVVQLDPTGKMAKARFLGTYATGHNSFAVADGFAGLGDTPFRDAAAYIDQQMSEEYPTFQIPNSSGLGAVYILNSQEMTFDGVEAPPGTVGLYYDVLMSVFEYCGDITHNLSEKGYTKLDGDKRGITPLNHADSNAFFEGPMAQPVDGYTNYLIYVDSPSFEVLLKDLPGLHKTDPVTKSIDEEVDVNDADSGKLLAKASFNVTLSTDAAGDGHMTLDY